MKPSIKKNSAEGFHNGSACSRSTVSPDGLFISAGSNNGIFFFKKKDHSFIHSITFFFH